MAEFPCSCKQKQVKNPAVSPPLLSGWAAGGVFSVPERLRPGCSLEWIAEFMAAWC